MTGSPFSHGPGSTHDAGCVECDHATLLEEAAAALAPSARFTVYGAPLSLNNAYPANRAGRRFASPALKRWKLAVALAARSAGARCVAGPVRVEAVAWFGSRRGDLDNIVKPILDALKGIAFVDDRQVEELRFARRLDKGAPRVEVSVFPLGESA